MSAQIIQPVVPMHRPVMIVYLVYAIRLAQPQVNPAELPLPLNPHEFFCFAPLLAHSRDVAGLATHLLAGSIS